MTFVERTAITECGIHSSVLGRRTGGWAQSLRPRTN